jgi:autotransporter-associated beta strand protein
MKTKLLIILGFTLVAHAYAGSATWNLNPTSSDWNDPLNWTPNTVPNSEEDVATFDVSNTTAVRITRPGDTVDHIAFTSTASSFTLSVGQVSGQVSLLTFTGLGIVNDSGLTQNILTIGSTVEFKNGSNAGVGTLFTADDPGAIVSQIHFFGTSSAGDATFMTKASTQFYDDSTAASATFNNNDGSILFFGDSTAGNATFNFEDLGPTGAFIQFNDNTTAGSANFALPNGGILTFADNSTAGQATITAGSSGLRIDQEVTFTETASAGDAVITLEGSLQSQRDGATLSFNDNSSAGNSVLVANSGTGSDSGGILEFLSDSTGGTARVELLGPVSGGGTLSIESHNSPSVTVGSIEGGGRVFLGSNNLTLGTNNLSTTFSGTIGDGDSGQIGGGLTKVGTGTLTLTGANTYTGGTIITNGILFVSNLSGSGTGPGPVNVNAGTLSGSGIITGAVTVGTNTGVQAFLAPSKGVKQPATLTIQDALTLNDDSAYIYKLKTKHAKADKVIANGVTIDSGAKFSFLPTGTTALTVGQVFTVISNTAATPISGTFHNLSDGEILTVNGNNLQGDYQGGDGNDLTLTVVP